MMVSKRSPRPMRASVRVLSIPRARRLLAAAAAGSVAGHACAQTADIFTGASGGVWSNPASWSAGVPQNSGTNAFAVELPDGKTVYYDLAGPAAVSSLAFDGFGSVVQFNGPTGNLTVTGQLSGVGTVNVNGGAFTTTQLSSAGAYGGNYLVTAGGTVTLATNLYRADYQDLRANKTLLSADGAGSTLKMPNVATLNGAAYGYGGAWTYTVQAINGGLLDLSSLTGAVGSPANLGDGDDRLQFLVASGGTMRLDHLATLSGNTRFDIQVPTFNLPALQSAVTTQFNLAAGTTLNAPVVASMTGTAVNLSGSATMNAGSLQAATGGSIALAGGAAFNATSLASLSGVSLSLAGGTLNTPALTSLTNSDLNLGASVNFVHGAITDADYSALLVSGGKTLSLPALQSYRADYADLRANKTLLSADGVGSTLSMPSVTTLNGAAYGYGGAWTYTLQALNGGLLDLSGLTTATGSPANLGDGEDRLQFLIASGGTMRLDHLATISGNTRFDIQVPTFALPALQSATTTQFNVAASSTLNTPVMASMTSTAVNLSGSATLNAPALQTVTGGSIALAGGAAFNATSLASLSSVSLSLAGGTLNAPALTSLVNTDLAVGASVNFIHGAITDADYSALGVSGGKTLSLPALQSYRADYADFRANKTLLSADGAGSVLSMPNVATLNGAAYGYGGAWTYTLQAVNGGLLDLSGLTNATGSPANLGDGEDRLQFLIASGGTMRLDHLATISGNTRFDVQVPTFTLPALQSAATSQFNLAAGSTLNAPVLASLNSTAVSLSGSATLNAPMLQTVTGGSIALAGGAAFNATSLASLSGVSLSLAGGTLDTPALTSLVSTDLAVGASVNFIHGAITDADYSALLVSGGKTLSLPALQSYRADYADFRANKTLLSADGAGSALSMPNVATLNGAAYGYSGAWVYTVQAVNGGLLDLSGLTTATGSPANLGDGEDRLQFLIASGGTMRLDQLATISGNTRFDIQVPTFNLPALQSALSTQFNLAAGSTLNTPAMASLGSSAVSLPGNATFNAPALHAITGGSIALAGGAAFNATSLASLSSVSLSLAGGTLNLPALTSLTNTDLALTSGVNFIHGAVNDADYSALSAAGGSTLSLPALQSYRADYQDLRANKTLLSANGAGSTLSLPSVATLNGAAYGYSGAWVYTVQAVNGGLLDLSGLTNAVGSPANLGDGEDRLQFLIASGGTMRLDHLATISGNTRFDIQVPTFTLPALQSATNSQFNLAAGSTLIAPVLASLTGTAVNLSGSSVVNAPALLSATGGSIALAGGAAFNATSLTSLSGVTLSLAGGTFNTPALTSLTGSDLTLNAGVNFVHGAVNDADYSALSVTGGSTLSLPALQSYRDDLQDYRANKVLLSANGAGSTLSMPNVATLNGAAYGYSGAWTYTVQAVNGGLLDLSGLTNAVGSPANLGDGEDRLQFLIASGGTMRLDQLATISGNTRFDIQVPTFTLPAMQSATTSQFNLAAGSTLNTPALLSLGSTAVSLPGNATFNAPALQAVTGGSIALAGGAAFNATSLASLSGVTLSLAGGTLNLPALTSMTSTDLALVPGVTFVHGAVSDVDYSALSVSGGVTLSLPAVQSYRADYQDYRASKVLLSADGTGSALSLANVATFNGAAFGYSGAWTYTAQAVNGGTLDLSRVSTITGSPSNAGDGDDRLQFLAASGGTLRLDSLSTISGNARFDVPGGSLVVGQPVFTAPTAVAISSNGSFRSIGDVKFKAGSSLSLTGGGSMLIGGDFHNEVTNSASFIATGGTVQFTSGGIHTLELAGRDFGAVDPGNNGNFGFGQLLVGQSGQPASVLELQDLIDNGNRGTNGMPEALYLGGINGGDGLQVLANSQLVIDNLNVYTKINNVWTYLQSLFATNQTSVPFGGGFITRTAQGWDVDANGNWLTAANWFNAALPNAVGATAIFGSRISAPRTISLTSAVTVGAIQFDNASTYTISGTSAINLQNTGQSAAILRTDQRNGFGPQAIAAPLNLLSPLSVVNNSTGTLSLTGPLLNPLSERITKTGLGTLVISGAQTHGAGTVIDAEGGTLRLGSDAGGNVTILANSARVNLDVTQNLGAINVGAGGQVVATAAGTGRLTHSIASLQVANGGTLDLTQNNLVTQTPIATVRAYLQSGFNGGNWAGGGITSANAKAAPSTYGIAYVGTANASVFLRPSLVGDSNLDGKVNGLDTRQIYTSGAFNDGKSTHDWSVGDVNYDGLVNGLDTRLIYTSGNFNSTNQAFVAPALAPFKLTTPAAGSIAVASASDGEPDLLYNPQTGDLAFTDPGGPTTIVEVLLHSDAGAFNAGNFIASTGSTSSANTLDVQSGSGIGAYDFGNVLPANLSRQQVVELLTPFDGAHDPDGLGGTGTYIAGSPGERSFTDVGGAATTPEPACLSLAGLAAAGLLNRRRRRAAVAPL